MGLNFGSARPCSPCMSPPPPPCSSPILIDAALQDPCLGVGGGSRSTVTFTVYDGSGAAVGTIKTGRDGTSSTAYGGSGPLSVTTPISGGRISLTGGLPCDTIAPADKAVNATTCGQTYTYTFAPTLQPWAICCSWNSGTGGPTCHQIPATITGTINGHTGTMTQGTGANSGRWTGTVDIPGNVFSETYDATNGCQYSTGSGTVPVQIQWQPCISLIINFPYGQVAGTLTGGYLDPAAALAPCIQPGSASLTLNTGQPYTETWNPLYISQTQSGNADYTNPWYVTFGFTSVTFSAGE